MRLLAADREIKNKVLEEIRRRAPNEVREDTVLRSLSKYDPGAVTAALQELVGQEAIRQEVHPAPAIGRALNVYSLASYLNVPIEEYIQVGDTKVPRQITTDKIRAEDLNEMVEALSEYSKSLEMRFQEIVRKETRGYWANIITLFGLFIALFSLIVTSFGAAGGTKSEQIIPLGIVLAGFVLVLKLLFR